MTNSPSNIKAGAVNEIKKESGEWIFVDVGFSENKRTCGFLAGFEEPCEITFSDLRARLVEAANKSEAVLNLMIEAPLSVAFKSSEHNPVARKMEKRGGQSRCWYTGLGCGVMVATTYLIRALHDYGGFRQIRLFEAFATFKNKEKNQDIATKYYL